MQHIESCGSNFEVYSLANWEPVQVDQDWCDVTVTRFLSNNMGIGQGCSEQAEGGTNLVQMCQPASYKFSADVPASYK